ncbi:MAG: hypothetical protein IKP23_06095 [Elusimicrobiaceae bacterium]|nr:hypothetical protein [Elusimicrobiaceae bacterium]
MASLTTNNKQKQKTLESKALNEQISLKIDSFISKQQIILETFIDNFIKSDSDIAYNQTLNSFVGNMAFINDIVILDNTGTQRAYFGPYYKFDYKDILDKIKQTTLKDKKIFFGGLKKNPIRKQLIFTMALPLQQVVNGRDGALLAQINMKSLEDEILSILPQDSFVLVFTQNGFLIFSSSDGISTDLNNEYNNVTTKLLNKIKDKELPMVIEEEDNGFISQNPLSLWYIYNASTQKEQFSGFISFYQENWQVCILSIIFVFILSLVISSYIFGTIEAPVRDMAKAIRIIEEGSEEPFPALPTYDNEIGDLCIRLARMLDTIKIKFDLLAEQQHDLEEINQSLELRVGSRTKELKTALNELIKKERLAAIGQMASIVSHEIKNPLAVISNSIYLIKARLGENIEPKIQKNINVIEGEIRQANSIIEEILGYARSREQILNIVDLTLYTKEILSSYPIPNNIKVETSFYKEPLYVKIDMEEMKQAIRNIMGNAFEVMPEGGNFVVKTKLEKGKALLSLRDSGPGIPEEIQNKIFTPFFTTKARGTGLGLAVVKKVASRNKAELILNSQVGKGTKITLLFNREEK